MAKKKKAWIILVKSPSSGAAGLRKEKPGQPIVDRDLQPLANDGFGRGTRTALTES
jgi:hypothetical protein